MKAAQLETVKDESAVSSEVDEEEILKEKAKRMVEEIPGLMKEEKDGESEVVGEETKHKNTVSQESGGGTSSQEAPGKQYSDKGTPYTECLNKNAILYAETSFIVFQSH